MSQEMYIILKEVSKIKRMDKNGNKVTKVSGNTFAYKVDSKVVRENIRVSFKETDQIATIDVKELEGKIIKVDGTYSEQRIVINEIKEIDCVDEELNFILSKIKLNNIDSEIFGECDNAELEKLKYEYEGIKIEIDISMCETDEVSQEDLLKKAEETYNSLDLLFGCIANEMKDKAWDNEGSITAEEFKSRLKVLYIIVDTEKIYLEIDDGDLFWGHRIHACFDFDFTLTEVDI